MSKNNSTIWSIEPHTEAKHVILRMYLDAWLPILTNWSGRVLYIDGFSGPGEYRGGIDGSPIIAINCVLKHKIQNSSEIVMIFIENNKNRYEFLENKLKQIQLPSRIKYDCRKGDFVEEMNKIFNGLEERNLRLAPAFVFIDPFGFNVPLSIITRIMKNKSCEVLITFMYEHINRFIANDNLKDKFKELFGLETDEIINNIKSKTSPQDKADYLHNLYKTQLENVAGIKYVKSFMMRDSSNNLQYFLFYGTNNFTGLKRMKEAMWKVDESGKYRFSDVTYNPGQPTLFVTEPDLIPLEKELKNFMIEKTTTPKILRAYTIIKTPFLEKHCNQILRNWEKSKPPELQRICESCSIDSTCKTRKHRFKESCVLRNI